MVADEAPVEPPGKEDLAGRSEEGGVGEAPGELGMVVPRRSEEGSEGLVRDDVAPCRLSELVDEVAIPPDEDGAGVAVEDEAVEAAVADDDLVRLVVVDEAVVGYSDERRSVREEGGEAGPGGVDEREGMGVPGRSLAPDVGGEVDLRKVGEDETAGDGGELDTGGDELVDRRHRLEAALSVEAPAEGRALDVRRLNGEGFDSRRPEALPEGGAGKESAGVPAGRSPVEADPLEGVDDGAELGEPEEVAEEAVAPGCEGRGDGGESRRCRRRKPRVHGASPGRPERLGPRVRELGIAEPVDEEEDIRVGVGNLGGEGRFEPGGGRRAREPPLDLGDDVDDAAPAVVRMLAHRAERRANLPGAGFGGGGEIPILAGRHPGTSERMSAYFQDYITVGVFAAVGVGLVAVMLGVAAVLRPSNPTRAKRLTYECGVDPVGVGWSQTYIRYFVFGLLFVLFDVEAVFIFPWAVAAESLGVGGLVAMVIFILTLVEGLVYAIRKGVLRWE